MLILTGDARVTLPGIISPHHDELAAAASDASYAYRWLVLQRLPSNRKFHGNFRMQRRLQIARVEHALAS